MKRETITNLVILVVVLLWAASIVTNMMDHTFQVPGTVQLIMTAVAAYLFGKQVVDRARTQGENEAQATHDEKVDLQKGPKGANQPGVGK
jgi:hypothetical protein